MDERLVDIFDQCVERLTHGASVEECLAAFPDERAELEQPLVLAAQLRALPHPPLPVATRVALEQSMLDIAKRRRMNPAPTTSSSTPAPTASWSALGPAAILAGLLRAMGYRGSLAQPWLRLTALALTIVLAFTLSAGALAAARALINIAQPQPTAIPTSAPTATPAALDGRIEQLAQERWVVGGRAVILTSTTVVSGTPALNATAHIQGSLGADGALQALRISVEPLAATPSATPTATPPAPTATQAPSPTPEPPPTPEPSAVPAAVPAAPPAPGPQPAPAPAPPPANDQQHTCQGQQIGRDDKKCDPKPKDDNKNDNKNNDKGKPDKNGKGKKGG